MKTGNMHELILFTTLISISTTMVESSRYEKLDTFADPLFNCSEEVHSDILNVTQGKCGCDYLAGRKSEVWCTVDETFGGTLAELRKNGYTNMDEMIFYFQDITHNITFDIHALSSFAHLRNLTMLQASINLEPISISFDNTTFLGCQNIHEIHIHIPLVDKSLEKMIAPLTRLEILDFNDVRNIGLKRMYATNEALPRSVRKLLMKSFQIPTAFGFYCFFIIANLLPHRYSNMTEIDLSNNGIRILKNGWYRHVPHLKYLDISDNLITQPPTATFYVELLMHPTIEVFIASNQADAFRNPLETDPTSFTGFHTREIISKIPLRENLQNPNMSLSTLECIDYHSKGNVSVLFRKDFTLFCNCLRRCITFKWYNLNCEYVPELYSLIDYSCQYWIQLPLGHNIREIHLNNIQAFPILGNGSFMYGNTLCFAPNNLTRLSLSSNPLWWKDYGILPSVILNNRISIRGLESIEEVDISKNNLDLYIDSSQIAFPAIKTLNLSYNAYIDFETNISFCKHKGLRNLTILDMSASLLYHDRRSPLSLKFVEHCEHLQELTLSRNNLNSSFVLSLNGMGNFRFLDLSSNNIEFINKQFATLLDKGAQRKHNVTIDISNNPLSCDCSHEALAFIKWFDRETKIQIKHFNTVQCRGEDGYFALSEVNYSRHWYKCKNIKLIMLTLFSTLAAVISMTLIIVSVRWRYRLRHSYFKLQHSVLRLCKSEPEENDYEYDAFVSYSSEDRFWVHGVLMKTLEETYGFKLAIHYRDISLGENIRRAIDDLMTKSRKYIIVMSHHFLESEWCQLEMEEAYNESLRRRMNLAVIVLGEVPRNITNPTARIILATYSYIPWKIDASNSNQQKLNRKQTLFWEKLVDYFYEGRFACPFCCVQTGPKSVGYEQVRDYANDEP